MEAIKERPTAALPPVEDFSRRHIGSGPADQDAMLVALGQKTLDALIDAVVPAAIRLQRPLNLPAALSEAQALA